MLIYSYIDIMILNDILPASRGRRIQGLDDGVRPILQIVRQM